MFLAPADRRVLPPAERMFTVAGQAMFILIPRREKLAHGAILAGSPARPHRAGKQVVLAGRQEQGIWARRVIAVSEIMAVQAILVALPTAIVAVHEVQAAGLSAAQVAAQGAAVPASAVAAAWAVGAGKDKIYWGLLW
jgi:hypothetical protein